MRSALWLVPIGAVVLSACGRGQQPPPFKPVADVKQLMQMVVDPAADDFWEGSGTVITAEGTSEREPRDDEEWTEVRNSAMAITEAGNLLMMVPRAKDGDQWMKFSRALVERGEEALRAAESKDHDKMFTAGGDLYEACTNCHQEYIDAIKNANK